MAFRPQYKNKSGNMVDLPLDADTVRGKEVYSKEETDTRIAEKLDLKADKKDVSEVDIDLEGTGTIVSIPENTTGYGTIEKLGGKSYKSKNLIVLSDVAETTTNGITYSIKNGVITLNGTASNNTNINIPIATYTLFDSHYLNVFASIPSGLYTGVAESAYDGKHQVNSNGYVIFNSSFTILYYRMYVTNGTILNNVIIKPMLVKGTTPPTEFSQGFEGIKIEYPTNVKVVGANKWSLGTKNINASTSVEFAELNLGAGTYTISTNATNGHWVVFVDSSQFGNVSATTPITFTVPTSYTRMRAFFNGANTNVDFMLNAGSKVLPYTPYTEQNLPQTNIINYVSNELQTKHSWTSENASKWLGLGVGNDSNIINYANNKKGDVKYSIIDMGTLEWVATSTSNVYETHSLKDYVSYKGFTSSYSNETSWVSASNLANKKILLRSDVVLIRDDTYTDADTFRQAMQGVMLIYELATPIEVDLSSLETEEHFECESNGSIIHDNLATYKYSFPVSLKGQVELNFEHDKEQQKQLDELKENKLNKSDLGHWNFESTTTGSVLNYYSIPVLERRYDNTIVGNINGDIVLTGAGERPVFLNDDSEVKEIALLKDIPHLFRHQIRFSDSTAMTSNVSFEIILAYPTAINTRDKIKAILTDNYYTSIQRPKIATGIAPGQGYFFDAIYINNGELFARELTTTSVISIEGLCVIIEDTITQIF